MTALAVVSAAHGLVAPAAADIDLAVTRLLETADQYARTFQNLTVEEITVHEEFEQSDAIWKHREIGADLVV